MSYVHPPGNGDVHELDFRGAADLAAGSQSDDVRPSSSHLGFMNGLAVTAETRLSTASGAAIAVHEVLSAHSPIRRSCGILARNIDSTTRKICARTWVQDCALASYTGRDLLISLTDFAEFAHLELDGCHSRACQIIERNNADDCKHFRLIERLLARLQKYQCKLHRLQVRTTAFVARKAVEAWFFGDDEESPSSGASWERIMLLTGATGVARSRKDPSCDPSSVFHIDVSNVCDDVRREALATGLSRVAAMAMELTSTGRGAMEGLVSCTSESCKTQLLAASIDFSRNAVEFGDSNAYVDIALAYQYGRGVEKDIHLASEWYRVGADRQSVSAMFELGMLYRKGHGVEKDEGLAFELLKRAAGHEYVKAYREIGKALEKGIGVEQNVEKAVHWYQAAAGEGCPAGYYDLGVCYRDGVGVPNHHMVGHDMFTCSAERGYLEALTEMGNSLLTPEHIPVPGYAGAAMGWYQYAAEMGSARAYYCIGMQYMAGEHVEKDYLRAMDFFQGAADLGSETAEEALKTARNDG